jgi:hypothetical protein
MGVFSTRNKALRSILMIMKNNYNILKNEGEISGTVADWFPDCDEKEIFTWDNLKKKIIKKLKEEEECEGFFLTNYKITKHIVDK